LLFLVEVEINCWPLDKLGAPLLASRGMRTHHALGRTTLAARRTPSRAALAAHHATVACVVLSV
ncbi:hypothetical protein HAX54_018172, partial [Datura stramonium]|nr:hypothetical protein [Datura stramonium]